MSSSKQRVAVIGAGPAGIAALRHLAEYPDKFIPVAFDKNKEVGGLWNYSDDTDKDEYGLPSYSSIYKQLRINLPKDIMCFPDKQFPEETACFAHHSHVKKYLNEYAKTHDINKYVKFQTLVTNVKPVESPEGVTWLVTSRNLPKDEVTTETFDRVFVCNGTECKPHVPQFPGSERFKGTLIHSKNHRDHEFYCGKTLLVVGASFSAQDIIFEVGPYAKKIYASHRGSEPLKFPIPDNTEDVPEIKEILPNGVILTNGECREVDHIILGTGFEINLDFLDPAVKMRLEGGRIQPLYNHVVHIEYSTLNIIGLLKAIPEFQTAFAQAHYACALARGEIKLPKKTEMYRLEEEDYQTRIGNKGLPTKLAHQLLPSEFKDYADGLEKITKYRPILPGIHKLLARYFEVVVHDYGTLKSRIFRLVGEDDFEEIV